MPRTKRDTLKRHCAKVIFYTSWAFHHAMTLYEIFLPHHPDLAELILKSAAGLKVANENARTFWEKSWGPVPENLEGWLK